MTSFHTDQPGTTSASAPPPECPAHARSTDGIARLFGPEVVEDAPGFFERLRAEHGPVAPVLVDGDLPAWLVLGYRENLEVLRTPSRFSHDSRLWHCFKENRVAPDSPLMPALAWQPVCLFMDGEEHERFRVALTESMGRLDRRGIRRCVTRSAHQLIDGFAADGQADLVSQFAEQLPLRVVAQLLGMPEEEGPRLVEATRDLLRGSETAFQSNEYLMAALNRLVAAKRGAPATDFTSWLMTHSAKLTEEEVAQHLRLVVIAGNENTTNLTANTLRMMLTDPRFRASLAGGSMTLPDALEQMLWDEPPTSVAPARWATGDTELGGQTVKAGDMLLLGLSAGNADPAIRPDLSVPMHGNRSHLAFTGGPHECPGQDIGRAIVDTGIDVLLMRLPDIELAVPENELKWVSHWIARHLTALPVKFAPRTEKRSLAADSASASADEVQSPPSLESSTASGRETVEGTAASPSGVGAPRAPWSWWNQVKRWLTRK
ncbi:MULTISPECIES: cytochrome P450 [unclassified Streptomyces]|uniref:cytochrome P450 n=1 Tax=unclassified Streptomyces TaxID=2593676 RepID=UPI00039D8C44|nr:MULTISPECIES: cytochrome P450 [unclassified Streptomyces]MYT29932.1 cytochrome P450 [Streptomyces sp. SID8354]